MAFAKTGTPMAIKIVAALCQLCGKNKVTCMADGKYICKKCAKTLESDGTR